MRTTFLQAKITFDGYRQNPATTELFAGHLLTCMVHPDNRGGYLAYGQETSIAGMTNLEDLQSVGFTADFETLVITWLAQYEESGLTREEAKLLVAEMKRLLQEGLILPLDNEPDVP